jgi:hypothetical protein
MQSKTFTHKGCGGSVVIDIAGLFEFKSPGISLTPSGVQLGVSEFRVKPYNGNSVKAVCEKCEKDFPYSDIEKVAEMRCDFCQRQRPVKEMKTFPPIVTGICPECQSALTGDSEPVNEKARASLKYMRLSANSVSFIPVSKILAMPISV